MIDEPRVEAAELIAALRCGQSRAAVEDALKRRVQSRLADSLIGFTPTLASTSPAPNAAPVTSSGGVAAAHGLRATISKGTSIAWWAPVFVLGALTGVGVDRLQLHHAAPRTTTAATAAPLAQASPEASSGMRAVGAAAPNAQAIAPESLELVSPTRAVATLPSAGAGDAASSLATERHLLDAARQALARGEPEAGMTPLGLHAKRFPRGVLAEEREALGVRLLAALGNRGAALERAQRFHQRFPNSLFTPAVDSAVAPFSKRNSENDSKP